MNPNDDKHIPLSLARVEGALAGARGLPVSTCPHAAKSVNEREWLNGHQFGHDLEPERRRECEATMTRLLEAAGMIRRSEKRNGAHDVRP